MFFLHAIGTDVHHTGDFCIDRPDGSGDLLLIIFKTDAVIRSGGTEQTVTPDSFIIFDRDTPQYYRAICGSYIDHYLHFDCDNADELSFAVLDRIITPQSIGAQEELLRMISRERFSESTNRDRYISMLINILLMKLCEEPPRKALTHGKAHSAELSDLRARMYSDPGQFSSVTELARSTNISPSHFQQLYREQFGTSCYEDLLTAKIKTAQYYLSTTSLSVKEISALCGYTNTVCFLHRFKDRTNMTPCEYRRRIGMQEGNI